MLDIKHQSGLLEAEQNLLQTSAGFNWDSAWQQIHALIRRMKWSFFFRTIKCSPVWRLDKTAARDNSETVKTTRRDSDSLFNWQSLQPAIVISTYSHLRHAPTKSVRVISMSAHSVRFCGQKTNSVFVFYHQCELMQRIYCRCQTCSLSTCSSARLELLPAVCHKAFHRATQQKLTITGFEVDVRMNPKAWTK